MNKVKIVAPCGSQWGGLHGAHAPGARHLHVLVQGVRQHARAVVPDQVLVHVQQLQPALRALEQVAQLRGGGGNGKCPRAPQRNPAPQPLVLQLLVDQSGARKGDVRQMGHDGDEGVARSRRGALMGKWGRSGVRWAHLHGAGDVEVVDRGVQDAEPGRQARDVVDALAEVARHAQRGERRVKGRGAGGGDPTRFMA